jgi:uncharacterized protein
MTDFLRAAAAVATIVATILAVITYVQDGSAPGLPSWGSSSPQQCVPSYSCRADQRFADRLVCETPDLCERDRRMDALYRRVRARTAPGDWPRVRQDQRDWWSERRNTCPDAGCLRRAYDERIATLEAEAAR